jgi:hypothetical protein
MSHRALRDISPAVRSGGSEKHAPINVPFGDDSDITNEKVLPSTAVVISPLPFRLGVGACPSAVPRSSTRYPAVPGSGPEVMVTSDLLGEKE